MRNRQSNRVMRGVGFAVLLVWLSPGAACSGKTAEKQPDKDPRTMAPMGMDRGSSDSRPDGMRVAPKSSVDEGLRRKLATAFGPKRKKALETIRAELKRARAAFDATARGKQLYQQLLHAVSILGEIAKKAKAGAVQEIPPLASMGYAYAMMGVMQLKAVAVELVKKGAKLAKRLKFGEAKKLVTQSKAMLALGKALRGLHEQYAATVKTLMLSKAKRLRLSTFSALVRGYPKAPKVAQKLLAPLLRRFHRREKHAPTKARMAQLLKSIQIATP